MLRRSKLIESSKATPELNEVPRFPPLTMDWIELSIPSIRLVHSVLSVAAYELKIEFLPPISEKRPFSSFLSLTKASMLILFFGVSLQIGSFLTISGASFFSHLKGPSVSFMGASAKKSNENFLVVSLTREFRSLLSIASKSLRSCLNFCSYFWSVNMSFVCFFVCMNRFGCFVTGFEYLYNIRQFSSDV